MALDYPSIDLNNKTNEQNIQSTKTYLIDIADQLNYKQSQNEDRLTALEAAVAALQKGE